MAFNPYFFCDSPLPMELIQKALKEFEYINPTLEDVKNKVDALVADLDGTIKDEVSKVINNMYESGELGAVIAQAIANSMTGKSGNIDLSHMGYILHKAHSWAFSQLPPVDQAFTIDEEYYNSLQGNSVFMINGNLYWACAYVCQNGSHFETNNAIRMYIYTINQDSSLSYITDREFAGVGHANGVGYCNGYIYITSNSIAGSGGGLTTNVCRISFDGENLGGVWSSNYNKYTVEVKTPTGVEGDFTDFVCGYNDVIYFADSNMSIYTFDWDSGVATKVYNRINGIEGYTGDGMSVTEDYIYMGASGYRIKRYNKQLGYVDWVYQLPTKANNGAFKIGEVEGFTVINGILYLAGGYNLSGLSTKYNTYSVTHFYQQNLATNDITIPALINWSNGTMMENTIFTTTGAIPSDRDNPRHIVNMVNYLDTNSIQMALDLIESNDYIRRATISIRQRRNTETIDIRTTKPITIDGSYYRTNIEKETSPSIGHIYTASNPSLYILNIIINNRLPEDISNSNVTDNCICSIGGIISVRNCAFSTGLITNNANVKYAIKAYYGALNVRTDEAYSTNPEQWESLRAGLGVTGAKYTGGSDIIRNINKTVTSN
jgi:hypothetical protein|nr:MAG TPA: hypothetical protein [Caudoviricetes sp.]